MCEFEMEHKAPSRNFVALPKDFPTLTFVGGELYPKAEDGGSLLALYAKRRGAAETTIVTALHCLRVLKRNGEGCDKDSLSLIRAELEQRLSVSAYDSRWGLSWCESEECVRYKAQEAERDAHHEKCEAEWRVMNAEAHAKWRLEWKEYQAAWTRANDACREAWNRKRDLAVEEWAKYEEECANKAKYQEECANKRHKRDVNE
jgi:hypothetical protein